MSELLNCPFCGAKADMQNDFGVEYWVQCTNLDCGATDGTNNSEPNSAALFWNRRAAPLPPAVDELACEIVAFEKWFTVGGEDEFNRQFYKQIWHDAWQARAALVKDQS